MEGKKVSLSTLFLVIALIVIIVMGVFIFMLYKEKTAETEKASELQTQVNTLNEKISQLQEKLDTISNTVNSSTEKQSETSNNQSSYNYTDLKEFWTNFRNAVLSNNYNDIKQYVKFPLQSKGPSDSSPIVNINEDDFEKTFKSFLQEYDGVGTTNKAESTVYNWIKNHEMPKMLSGSDYDNASSYVDVVRVANDKWASFNKMDMEKDSNGYWKLTLIYSNN